MPSDAEPQLIEVEATFGRILSFQNDLITDQIVEFGAHTRPELAFLLSVVRPKDRAFDLGGHIGTFAIPLAQKIGVGGRLLVVEGDPTNFSVLARNVAGAQLAADTVLLNTLIASSGQSYRAQTPDRNTGGTWFLPAETADVEVETTTLDDLCHRYFTPRVLKIDIEGWELFALGGSQLLHEQRPIIYAEINDPLLNQQGASIDALDRLLRGAGYRLFRNVGDRNASHDNFVVAELPTLADGGRFFDVLAIHADDDRLGSTVALLNVE